MEETKIDFDKLAVSIIEAYLEDAINYLLLRILFPMPGDHYTPTDSDGSAGVDGVPINME